LGIQKYKTFIVFQFEMFQQFVENYYFNAIVILSFGENKYFCSVLELKIYKQTLFKYGDTNNKVLRKEERVMRFES